MAVWDKKILWSLVFLLAGLYPGALGEGVNYPDPVCAVKGSTVTLLCSFTPLKSVKVNGREVLVEVIRVRWCQNHGICQGATPSVYDSASANNNPRYKYLGDRKGNCTLQITDIQTEDDATFRFRVETSNIKATFTGPQGVEVTVTAAPTMRVHSSSVDAEVTQGQNLTLHCTASCTFHPLELTWFKDGHALRESGPALRLGPLTAEDSGNYTCALRNNNGTLSLPYRLQVEAEQDGGTTTGPVTDAFGDLTLVVPVVSAVLLVLFALIVVLCIIQRKKAAAATDQRAVGGQVGQKHPDNIYSNILLPSAQEGGGHRQEAGRVAEEVSYAAIHFKHKNPDRPAEEAEDAIVYSALASRG